jgi:hypothetical protein
MTVLVADTQYFDTPAVPRRIEPVKSNSRQLVNVRPRLLIPRRAPYDPRFGRF